MKVDYRARIGKVISFKSDIYEVKFAGTQTTFREVVLKLRELLCDWLCHISIKESTAHWHKFKIETLAINSIVPV